VRYLIILFAHEPRQYRRESIDNFTSNPTKWRCSQLLIITHHRSTERHLPCGIAHYYLSLGAGEPKPSSPVPDFRDDHKNGIPDGNRNLMGISWKWDLMTKLRMGMERNWNNLQGMGMTLIPMGINSRRRLVLTTILFCMENNS